MASRISYHDQFFHVSNSRFDTLIEFAIEVGERTAISDGERSYILSLKERKDAFYPGYDLAIESEFSSKEERKFLARVFYDLTHLIFLRQIGNQDAIIWQHSAIGDAYLLGRMKTRSVQDEEQAWHPKGIAAVEAEVYFQKGVNVRL